MLTNLRDTKSLALLALKRSAHRAQNFAVERGRLVERVHHVRGGDCALKRGGTFDGARDETRLERLVFVFEGENENTRIVARFHEAISAFFLQKCSLRLIGLDERCADLREETQRQT